jgi:hypothetical protein
MKTYHRVKTETQTIGDAIKQQNSMQVFGFPPRHNNQSDIPKVKAFDGPLPEGREGIEFTTGVEPDRGSRPGKPCWSGPRPGVIVEDNCAKIKIESIRVVYSPIP